MRMRARVVLLSIGLLVAACGSSPPTAPAPSPTVAEPADADFRASWAVLDAYMTEVTREDYDRAWTRLSPAAQAGWGSPQEFAAERAAFRLSTGGLYRMAIPSHDLGLLAQWVSPDDPARPPLERAFIAEVRYPRLENNNAGWEMLVVAPDATGRWLIWKVR